MGETFAPPGAFNQLICSHPENLPFTPWKSQLRNTPENSLCGWRIRLQTVVPSINISLRSLNNYDACTYLFFPPPPLLPTTHARHSAFSSPEAALLLVSTKNRDLRPSPTPEIRDSRTFRHSVHAQSQVWQIWLVPVSFYCVCKANQNRNLTGPMQRSWFLVLIKRSAVSGGENGHSGNLTRTSSLRSEVRKPGETGDSVAGSILFAFRSNENERK